ncbi:hypothetical protein SAMN05216464_1303 [Mucilaginibacter pineti]|uniref:HTH cro/C1-type domain-containing protein n=1 Tax=Mucilaginibacter pineti TaxID=1391627 RepID=A0A1G7NUD4_9SPHI|nr:hypothetical protein [Mucilaginibacter pineti]SDF77591.1 hypothetical protein SAMN05216464_1303 [Mucilaginibacter pineti]
MAAVLFPLLASKEKRGQNNINLLLKGIGKFFISLRKNKGFKNARLFAELHNIDPGQYNKYERVNSDMQLSSLIKVFNIYGLNEEDIFTPKILSEIKGAQSICNPPLVRTGIL